MPSLTVSTALTAWQFEPVVSVWLAMLAAGYLTGVRAVARRHPARPWPAARTVCFGCGLLVIAVATLGSPGVYDEELLGAHMVQHLLLIMVAPPLLVFGRPVTLLLHATRNPWHTAAKRVLRSRACAALTWPGSGLALYAAVVVGTHLTGLVAARGAVHDGEHALYLVAGYLYFLPVVGSEPIRWRLSTLGRYLLLLAAMPADIAVGAALMLRGPMAGYGAGEVRAGGLIMLAGSELVMTALAVALAVAMLRDRAAARPAADLGAYNAYLASLEK